MNVVTEVAVVVAMVSVALMCFWASWSREAVRLAREDRTAAIRRAEEVERKLLQKPHEVTYIYTCKECAKKAMIRLGNAEPIGGIMIGGVVPCEPTEEEVARAVEEIKAMRADLGREHP